MPARQPILSLPQLGNAFDLECALAALVVRRLLTNSQYAEILRAVTPALPCALLIEQRTPKGVTYVRAGAQHFSLDHRCKLSPIKPD